ncbi:MAG: DUF3489 domain-containing protein [Pseudomonadota bacterium]
MSKSKPTTKIAILAQQLKRAKGATLSELEEATGWQQHSIRATITGLRKKGRTIERTRCGEVNCYHIIEASS